MKKYLSIFFVCALTISLGGTYANAQTTDSQKENLKNKVRAEVQQMREDVATTKEAIHVEIEKVREDAKVKMDALKVKMQTEKSKVKAAILETRITGREEVLQKFDTDIEKLNTLESNVNTKITKMEAQGVDTTEAKAQVLIADGKIAEAKGKIAEASTLLSNSSNELTKENKAQLKQLTMDIQTLVTDTHAALNQAVQSLKVKLQNKIDAAKTATEKTN